MALMVAKNLKKYFRLGPGQTIHAVDGISLAVEAEEVEQ